MKTIVRGALNAFSDPGQIGGTPSRLPLWLQPPLGHLQSLALLGARLFVAQVFFLSGLTKLRDWSITLALFEDEYHVPLLSPELAAYLGTAGELVLPVLLVLGLGTRFAVLGLSFVNVMAVLSLAEIAPAALAGHQLWGGMLVVVGLWGAGRWSADALITRAAGS